MPFTLPGETVEVELEAPTKTGAQRGVARRVLSPSAERVSPPCPHFTECGGCQLQHLSATYYAAFKQELAQQALRQAGYDASILAPLRSFPLATRRRVELRLARAESAAAPNSDSANGLQLGYLQAESHRFVAISECPILAPALQNRLPALRLWLSRAPAEMAADQLRLTQCSNGIDAALIGTQRWQESWNTWALTMAAELGLLRLSYETPQRTQPIIKPIMQTAQPVMQMGKAQVAIPNGAFLQASEAGEEAIIEAITAHLPKNTKRVADIFCGLGTYSFRLAERYFTHGFEVAAPMAEAAQMAAKQSKLQDRLRFETRDIFRFPLGMQELSAFDAVIVNPPRAGAEAQTRQIARSKLRHVCMVSCERETFSRDAAILRQAGFELRYAQAIDQFSMTPHLEMVAHFTRKS